MATFEISKALGVHFKINTGSGAANAGAVIDDNYLWSERASYFDCEAKMGNIPWCQLFHCNDTTIIQVKTDIGVRPLVLVEDMTDPQNPVEVAGAVMTNVSGEFYNAVIDWSGYDCGTCYQIKIYTYTQSSNLYLCGGTPVGDFETGVGTWNISSGTNVQSQTTASNPVRDRIICALIPREGQRRLIRRSPSVMAPMGLQQTLITFSRVR